MRTTDALYKGEALVMRTEEGEDEIGKEYKKIRYRTRLWLDDVTSWEEVVDNPIKEDYEDMIIVYTKTRILMVYDNIEKFDEIMEKYLKNSSVRVWN